MSVIAINSIKAYTSSAEFRKSTHRLKEETPKVKAQLATDTYASSLAPEHKSRLDEIKGKVKSGYYDSNEVTEDISDSFARYFDRAIR